MIFLNVVYYDCSLMCFSTFSTKFEIQNGFAELREIICSRTRFANRINITFVIQNLDLKKELIFLLFDLYANYKTNAKKQTKTTLNPFVVMALPLFLLLISFSGINNNFIPISTDKDDIKL